MPLASRSKPARWASPAEVGATVKVTLYVDRDTDEFMEAARVEGLTSRPKVDVSRGAVVRLALRRLMDDMSPVEVKALLADQVVRDTGPAAELYPDEAKTDRRDALTSVSPALERALGARLQLAGVRDLLAR